MLNRYKSYLQSEMASKKSEVQLRNQVEKLLYTASSSPEFLDFLGKHQDKIKSFMTENDMFERKKQENMFEIDQMVLNNKRYADVFRLAKKLGNVDVLFRKADYVTPIGGLTLNTSAFLNTIELLGTPEQAKKWRDLVMTAQAIGGYGQTELGHGSNVQGLETQAHYDDKKQVFRINSPTITSAKFWPGVLGSAGTHAVLQAKTFVKGKPIGIQTFVVPIRDHNLDVLEGVEAGDIGNKLGFQRVDNGYLRIHELKIPRESMLMKYIQVTAQGDVLGLENKESMKYAYGSMLYLRVFLVYGFAFSYMFTPAKLLFEMYKQKGVANQPEKRRQVTEYFCTAIGTIMANTFTQKIYNQYIFDLNAENFDKADKLLVNCHILSATFKALSSWKGVEISRQILNKDKYMVFRSTQVPSSFGSAFPSVTYEGDNSVLLQQTSKFILMKESQEQITTPNLNIRDDDLQGISKVLKYVTRMEIRRVKKIFEKQYGNGVGMKTFWNEKHQRDVIEVSKLWGLSKFIQGVIIFLEDHKENNQFFTKVAKVFAKCILDDAKKIFLYGFKIDSSDSWNTFSEQQFWAISNIRKPVDPGVESHSLIARDMRVEAKL